MKENLTDVVEKDGVPRKRAKRSVRRHTIVGYATRTRANSLLPYLVLLVDHLVLNLFLLVAW